jgi:hypothetical protein
MEIKNHFKDIAETEKQITAGQTAKVNQLSLRLLSAKFEYVVEIYAVPKGRLLAQNQAEYLDGETA